MALVHIVIALIGQPGLAVYPLVWGWALSTVLRRGSDSPDAPTLRCRDAMITVLLAYLFGAASIAVGLPAGPFDDVLNVISGTYFVASAVFGFCMLLLVGSSGRRGERKRWALVALALAAVPLATPLGMAALWLLG